MLACQCFNLGLLFWWRELKELRGDTGQLGIGDLFGFMLGQPSQVVSWFLKLKINMKNNIEISKVA
jgi:hypothetical protein